jgi:hypothetical protein
VSLNGSGSASIAIDHSQFSFNKAGFGGSGVFTADSSSLHISNSLFYANSAVDEGGGVDAYGNTAITDCLFSDNTADFGAAVSLSSSPNELFTQSVTSCAYTSNHARTSGGALYIGTNCEVTVGNSTFSNNSAASSAGSIFADTDSVVNISTSSFTSGSAGVGGVLVTTTYSAVVLKDVKMSRHTASNGGAISAEANLTVFDSTFSNSTARTRGGFLVGETDSVVLMFNSSVSDSACQGNFTDAVSLYLLHALHCSALHHGAKL